MTSSFPYLFFMIRDFHLTEDEKEIGRYAGFLASSFSFAQFFSGKTPPTGLLMRCAYFRITLGTVVRFVRPETDCVDGIVGNGVGDIGFWILDFFYAGFACEDGGRIVERECRSY